MTATLLVVDGDGITSAQLLPYLAGFGYAVEAARHERQVEACLRRRAVQLLVVDTSLDEDRCFDVARRFGRQLRIPLIVLSERGDTEDRIRGLELGADAYLPKPFVPRELVACVQSLLRRTQLPRARGVGVMRFGDWALNTGDRSLASATNAVVDLTGAEYRLLLALLHKPQQVLTREQLAEASRGHALAGVERSVDLLVSRLRRKLEGNAGRPALIRTVRGVGYLLDSEVHMAAPTS